MREAWIIDAVRTPIGRYGGALAGVRPDDLAAVALRALVERTGLEPALIDDVILGCANQAGEDNRNVGRMASLLAGFPVEVPGQTVNRLCGSGMQAVVTAFHAIRAGEGDIFVAGGVESMSRAPWALLKPAEGYPRGVPEMADTVLGWRFVNPRFQQRYILALADHANGDGSVQPLAAFMTNPAGSAIVNAVGPIRQIVQGFAGSEKRYLVIAPGDASKFGEAVQVQTP